ncbi:MAG: hypothetical protein V8T90_05300 [Victivallales bacterium]
METSRVLMIRRAILTALFEYKSYQDIDTVFCNPSVINVNPTREELKVEWAKLISFKMIEPLPEYNGTVCRLTADVLKTMEETNRNPPKDPRLWGYGVC